MTERWNRVVLALLGGLILAMGARAGVDEGVVDRLTEEMRRAVANDARPPNEGVLIAMRELRDERLRPLFAGMALRDEPSSKLHGIFGLADLTPERKVSIGQIAGVSDEGLRALILGRAIGGDYLTTRHMRQILNWPEIEPSLELSVTSKLMSAGEEVSVERLRTVAASCPEDQIASRVFALLLIAQLEGDSKATEARARLEEISPGARAPLVAFALTQIISERLLGLREFVIEMHEWARDRPHLRLQSIATLLVVEPGFGAEEWRTRYASESDLATRIRLALVLLQGIDHVGSEAFAPLIGDELPLIDHMGRAGHAVASGEGEAPALATLLADEHALSTAWAFETIAGFEPERRSRVLIEILSMSVPRASVDAKAPGYLYEAARELESVDPGAIAPVLDAACESGDERLCEALLAAINGTRPHIAWEIDAPPAWPGRTSLVLSVIAEARAGNALGEEDLAILISAGTGGESLPPAFRAQAAWLALCQIGRDREALTKILAPARE